MIIPKYMSYRTYLHGVMAVIQSESLFHFINGDNACYIMGQKWVQSVFTKTKTAVTHAYTSVTAIYSLNVL